MNKPELLLDNQICFLVYRLNRSIGSRYRPFLDGLGLTYPQYLVMLALWEHTALAVGDLCRLLDLDTGTVSPLVKRMEGLSLVQRKRETGDERSVTVSLTEKGTALEERALSVPGSIAACLLADQNEYDSLKATLQGLLRRLEGSEAGLKA